MTEALVDMGFLQSHFDYPLFTKMVGHGLLIILVYVDDLLVTGRNLPLIKQVKKDLEESFKITDLGE